MVTSLTILSNLPFERVQGRYSRCRILRHLLHYAHLFSVCVHAASQGVRQLLMSASAPALDSLHSKMFLNVAMIASVLA